MPPPAASTPTGALQLANTTPAYPGPLPSPPPLEDMLIAAPRTARTPEPRPVPHEFRPAGLAEQAWRDAAALPVGSLLAISSADGGVGRSTMVAALGSLLALAVTAPVVAVDANPRPWGGMGERVGPGSGTVWDAVRELPRLTSRTEVERWTRRGPSGLLGLAGEVEVSRHRHPPTHHEALAVAETLRALYPLVLLDLMTAEIRGAWHALAAASAALLVARATSESIQHTLRLLAYQRSDRTPQAPAAPLLVVVSTSPRTSGDVRAVLRQAATVAVGVHSIPYDPMLADAAPIDARHLAKATRRALLELAADVLHRCTTPLTGAIVGAS
jgi:MinD-like ATPase involved in chromosome partitioning or flagellar assembly